MQKACLVFCVLSLIACDKDDKAAGAAGGSASGPSASSRDGVIEAWKKAGLTVSAMTPANVAFGKDCQSGTVAGIDVLVCQYPTPAEAKTAEEAGLGWVGETTGISQSAGTVLITAADRRKADPSGRTMNQLTKLLKK